MTDYAETMRQHRRLKILEILAVLPGYTSNSSMLQDILVNEGLRSTLDQVTTEIAWLAEQGFVAATGEDFVVVMATGRGAEIARGLATHPGIQRPSPRA